MLADVRRHQENKDFEQVVGLRNGHSISTDIKKVIESGKDAAEIAKIIERDGYEGLDGDDLDSSGLSGGNGNENGRRPCTTFLVAQPSARGLRGGDIARHVAKRVLLEQTIANSAAKKLDGDHWFDKGKKPKKAQHYGAQERMDDLMEGMDGDHETGHQRPNSWTRG